ncbi:MAG: hypothetical protein L0Z73_04960 [Gammaproteobacteria bacterium]|nr:hypothetical protein [Gammaproteobacteria bacterium]
MNKQTSNEQIVLHSNEFEDKIEKIELNQLTLELLQNAKWKEQQKLFRIFDKKFLNINAKNANKTRTYNIHLSLLDANPVRKHSFKIRYLLIACILFGLAGLTYRLIQLGIAGLNSLYMYALPILFITAGAIMIVYAVKQYKHVLIFYSNYGRVPLASLLYNNPAKKSFKQFAGQLVNCIHAVKSGNRFSEQQALAAELSELRRLRDEGVFSDTVYEQAKNNILTYHSRPAGRNSNRALH